MFVIEMITLKTFIGPTFHLGFQVLTSVLKIKGKVPNGIVSLLSIKFLFSFFPPVIKVMSKSIQGGVEENGGRVRRRDHLPPHRYIRNTSTRGTAPIEHPLNAGRRPQTSQKARNSPCT